MHLRRGLRPLQPYGAPARFCASLLRLTFAPHCSSAAAGDRSLSLLSSLPALQKVGNAPGPTVKFRISRPFGLSAQIRPQTLPQTSPVVPKLCLVQPTLRQRGGAQFRSAIVGVATGSSRSKYPASPIRVLIRRVPREPRAVLDSSRLQRLSSQTSIFARR